MNENIPKLLHRLREAIHEALADSKEVEEAMAALDRAGQSPTFAVDVKLEEEPPVLPVSQNGELALTPEDEEFLRSLRIVSRA